MTPAVKMLERARIAHRLLSYDHDPAAASFGLEAAGALGLDPDAVHKTLVCSTPTGEMIVAVVPVSGDLDLKALASATGEKKVIMARPEDAQRSSGYVVGGISPLGQRRRLRTFIDTGALRLAEMFVSGGRRGLDIGLAPSDLVSVCGAELAPIAAPPH